MENLDFGWQLGLLIVAIAVIVYSVVALLHYLAGVAFSELLQRIMVRLFPGRSFTFVMVVLPHFVTALILYFILFRSGFYLIARSGYFLLGSILSFYITNLFSHLVSFTTLLLSRYAFDSNWRPMGKLRKSRMAGNFALWTLITAGLNIPAHYGYGYLYILFFGQLALVLFAAWIFLRWRCVS